MSKNIVEWGRPQMTK